MLRIAFLVVPLASALLLGNATDSPAQEAQPCSTANEPQVFPEPALFHPVKPRGSVFTFRPRDLEFQWDAMYDRPSIQGEGLSETDMLTLEKLGETIADRLGGNPFGANLSDIRLVYEYFRADTTAAYNINPLAPYGIAIGVLEGKQCAGSRCGESGLQAVDRGHVDHYLYLPGHNGNRYNQYPSQFYTAKEDSSTIGRWLSDANWVAWGGNSIMSNGPADASDASRTDLAGTGWTRPGGGANVAFCHEFQHSLTKGGVYTSLGWDEIFGVAAEAIAGNALPPSNYDVSYVFGLGSTAQQQHNWMFACYLAYNFRGIDTAPTLTGFQDDLLYRWAKGDRHLYALPPLLSDANCAECSPALKPYFHPGGVPLDNHSRLQLLIHNWRVANFVNKSSLANGQYGYPPQFGFSPKDNAGAWQSRDGDGPNDVHAIPPEVGVGPSMAVRETTMVGTRYSAAGSFPMSLHPFGSEYWVARADPSLGTTSRDLVVRVSPEGIHRCLVNDPSGGPQQYVRDVRLMTSVVGYSVPAESLKTGQLWAHPEWATQALAPIWVDVDSVAGGLELVLPGFGTSVNAAVVVISLGDGPSGGWANSNLDGSSAILPYRLNLALRASPFQDPNPVALLADPLLLDESPAWSPEGNEIAFVRRDLTTGVSGIYRKSLTSGSPVLLGTAGPESRSDPDWSPRGDWIAFSREGSGSPAEAHIWAVNRWTQELRQITSGQGSWDSSPVFEPHGQRIAYLRNYFGEQPGILTEVPGSLRRCSVDGSGDVLLAEFNPPIEAGSLRWSPDGRFIYYARNGSLYAVPADGGTPIPRPALLTGANSFDLHRGQGRLLYSQAGVINMQGCAPPPQASFPFVRLALRDTLANDTQARFYRTGAQFYEPRWSPDGTRIAYSSNQNTANDPTSADRDLFVGQVSFNHPPYFPVLTDQTIPAGPAFEMEVWAASDPDGEALTDDAPSRYLPPGASFDPATHRFSWPNPGPAMSEHFVVFRRMDGSGGVATRVVRIAVTAAAIADLNLDVVGSDLVWLTWTAPGPVGGPAAVEYDLRYAPYAITEGSFGIASRVGNAPLPAAPGSPESHMIGSLQACTPYWFAIKSKDAGGNWSPISNVPTTTTMCGPGGGGEVSAREAGPAVAGIEPGRTEPAFARPGEGDSTRVALVVEMAGTALAPRWSVHYLPAAEQAALEGDGFSGIVLQAPDAGAGWRERARLALPGRGWRFGLRALRRPARLIFLGAYDLQQTWNVVTPGGANAASAVALTTARHSRLGDLTTALGAADGYDAGLTAGDTLSLRYGPAAEGSESAQPWFMVVGPPGSTGGIQGFRRQRAGEAEVMPTAFALRQNRPNPFSGTTEIRFELPVPSPVRLEVFDAQGRLVRTLANGDFPVGFHSVVWDQRDAAGARVRPGIYLYRIAAGAFRHQRKMMML